MKVMDKTKLRSKCCGATTMSAEGQSVYCSKCGGICEIMSPEYDRIERMLKYLVIQRKLEKNHQERLTAGEIQNKELFEQCVENRKGLRKQLPDISDIIRAGD